jgi:hypothetical protein
VYDLADEQEHVAPLAQADEGGAYGYQPSPAPARMHVTGTQLRHRLISPETIAAIHEEEPKKSLVQSLLGRVRKRG